MFAALAATARGARSGGRAAAVVLRAGTRHQVPMGAPTRGLSESRFVIHAAQKPAEPRDVDFDSLGLKYPVTHKPEWLINRTTWSPPPASPPTNLPFAVDRTAVGASLPVYTDYKAGRTKVVTILRKCRGDIAQLRDEMEKVVGKPVIVRPGKLVVNGNFHARLKLWLAGLGF